MVEKPMQAQGEHVDSTQKGPAPTKNQTQDSAHDYATITKRKCLGVLLWFLCRQADKLL